MKYVLIAEGWDPVYHASMPDPDSVPCDTYAISLRFNTLMIRTMQGRWQVVDDYEMPTVPKEIRAYMLLLGE